MRKGTRANSFNGNTRFSCNQAITRRAFMAPKPVIRRCQRWPLRLMKATRSSMVRIPVSPEERRFAIDGCSQIWIGSVGFGVVASQDSRIFKAWLVRLRRRALRRAMRKAAAFSGVT